MVLECLLKLYYTHSRAFFFHVLYPKPENAQQTFAEDGSSEKENR